MCEHARSKHKDDSVQVWQILFWTWQYQRWWRIAVRTNVGCKNWIWEGKAQDTEMGVPLQQHDQDQWWQFCADLFSRDGTLLRMSQFRIYGGRCDQCGVVRTSCLPLNTQFQILIMKNGHKQRLNAGDVTTQCRVSGERWTTWCDGHCTLTWMLSTLQLCLRLTTWYGSWNQNAP